MRRPSRFADQVVGKALAEVCRGCGFWPLHEYAVALEPPFEPYNPYQVTAWDCFFNGWEAGWESSPIKRLVSSEAVDVWEGVTLPPVLHATDSLRRLAVARFPEDEATLANAEQLLRALPQLSRPVAFEIVGLGPQPEYDRGIIRELTQAHLRGEQTDLREAIRGWQPPRIVTQFAGANQDLRRLERLLLAHYPNSAVVMEEILSDDPLEKVDLRNEGYGATLGLESGYCFPLRPANHMAPDPLAVPISAMDHLGNGSSRQWIISARSSGRWCKS